MMIAVIPGDTFPVGCAFDESIVHHKVITHFCTCSSILFFFSSAYLNLLISILCWACFYSISRKILTTKILLITLNMGFTLKVVAYTMSGCHGGTMITCTWYTSNPIFLFSFFKLNFIQHNNDSDCNRVKPSSLYKKFKVIYLIS